MVYEFARQLQMGGAISQETYNQVKDRFDAAGVVELTALIGYYTMVSMTLNAHSIPLPEGAGTALEPVCSAEKEIPGEDNGCGVRQCSPQVLGNIDKKTQCK